MASASFTPGKLSPLLKGAKGGLDHFIYTPSSWTSGSKHPTILFLHGAGGVANPENLIKMSMTKMLIDGRLGGDSFPFIVIKPIARERPWPSQFENLDALLGRLVASEELGIDKSKFYIVGQSMGGNGCIEYAARSPEMFAAMAPVCAYVSRDSPQGSPELAKVSKALANMPIWAFHGANDAIVSVEHTDAFVESVRAAGNKQIKYTRYDEAPGLAGFGDRGAGHASFELAFAEKDLYLWLLKASSSL